MNDEIVNDYNKTGCLWGSTGVQFGCREVLSLMISKFRIIGPDMDDLDLIKQKINIVDLISEYLPLKKAGINFKAPCPFHSEKTPSFVVSPERQIWHCFGCQKGGDIFTFLMEKEGLEFKEALEILAKKAGVTLQKMNSDKKGLKDRLLEANLKAQEFFHYILTKHPLGKPAMKYLHDRGLIDETIEEFGIGYSPNSWDSLTKFLLKRSFTNQEIVDTGLAVASKVPYDRFRGRITFPLIDTKGSVIGFSGRVLYAGEPKYINTPQTILFDKSRYLFAMNLAKAEIRAKHEAILVEGEMDVVLSHQVGIKNVVASKGTALTEGQIDLLKKYADTISLCFDTDLAGDAASRRGIEIADKAGLNIKVISVKDGKDPAEAAKKDPKIWQESIAEATPIYDYYLLSAAKRYDIKKPEDLKKMSQELIPIWAKISDDLVRERYIQKLSGMIRQDEVVIREAINKQKIAPGSFTHLLKETISDVVINPLTRRELLEEYLIALLLHIPKDYTYVPNFPETLFVAEKWRQLYVVLVLYLDSISFKGQSFEINDFVKQIPADSIKEVDRLYLVELDSKLIDKNNWVKELDGVVMELKRALVKASLEKLAFEIKNAQEFGKIEVVEVLNKRFRDLSVKLKNL
ncbi:MAG: DNA primase [Candidatus Daviesbacteria bacterium]|nr:DNA primase [Candidatus Daviesbacteria bacterium]